MTSALLHRFCYRHRRCRPWLVSLLMLLPLSVAGQSLPPPPSMEPSARDTEQTAEDIHALKVRLDALKRKREELQARRDELVRREENLAAGQEPATPEQIAEIERYQRQAREAYQNALMARQRLVLLEQAQADLVTSEPLEVDPERINLQIQAAVARLRLNVRSAPDVESRAVTGMDAGESILVLGNYDNSQWLLVSAQGHLGFVRQAELNAR